MPFLKNQIYHQTKNFKFKQKTSESDVPTVSEVINHPYISIFILTSWRFYNHNYLKPILKSAFIWGPWLCACPDLVFEKV